MSNENHSSLLTLNSSLIITLPPRNDTEAEIFVQYDFPAGELNFDGQDFNFPSGLHAEAVAKWLEDSLLSVEISISASATASCARCLKDSNLEISGNLSKDTHPSNAKDPMLFTPSGIVTETSFLQL